MHVPLHVAGPCAGKPLLAEIIIHKSDSRLAVAGSEIKDIVRKGIIFAAKSITLAMKAPIQGQHGGGCHTENKDCQKGP